MPDAARSDPKIDLLAVYAQFFCCRGHGEKFFHLRFLSEIDTLVNMIPAEPKPHWITAIIDTREQLPLDLSPLRSQPGTLATGDYSVRGLESLIAVERKGLDDLISCCGTERERFEREIQRLLAYQTRAVVVEATWPQIEFGGWRSKVTAACALSSCLGWIAAGVPIVMARDHVTAGKYVCQILWIAARRRWREIRNLIDEKS